MGKQITMNRKALAGLLAFAFLLAFLLPLGFTTNLAMAAGEEELQAEEQAAQMMNAQDLEPQAEAMDAFKGIVVVDPGHVVDEYGSSKGASAPDGSTNEAKLNPVMAEKIASLLQQKGYKVYTTFKVSENIPFILPTTPISLYNRALACNAMKPDVFISVHHNSSNSSGVFDNGSGAEALYAPEQDAALVPKSMDLAQFVSSSVRSLSYTKGNRASAVKGNTNPYVLKYSTAAATTLEVGFLTNKTDLANVQNETKKNEIAAKAVEGIEQYFAKYPSNKPDPNDKAGPRMSALAFSEKSPTYKPSFVVKAKGVQDTSGVKAVKFRIWRSGDTASQKNIAGKHDGNGNWTAAFKLAQFANKAGTYKVTAYGTDNAGNTSNMGTAQIVIREDKAKPSVSALVFGEKSPTFANSFAIQAQNVADDSGVQSVTFRVWRSGATGTAKNLTGMDKGNGNWDAAFNLASWGNTSGTYTVNVYVTDKRGNTGIAKTGSIVVKKDTTAPTMGNLLFGVKSPTDQPSFAIQANNVKDDDQVKEVKFRVWRVGTTNATKTFAGVNKGDGNWDMLLHLKDFKYENGTYKVQAYGYDRSGNGAKMGEGSIVVDGDFDTKPPTMNKLLFGESNPTIANTFAIQAQGVQDESGVDKVRFRVYCEADGEKSYKTFDGVQKGINWEMTFKLSEFKNKTGTYVVQAYGYDKMENAGMMGSGSIRITGDTSPPYMENLVFAVPSPTSIPEFTIQANDVSDPAGVESIRFRVWNKADRKTVKNYAAVQSGNHWNVLFKLSDFGNQSGEYMVNVYGTDKKGNVGVIGSGSIVVNRAVGNVFIMGNSEGTIEQMVNFFKSSRFKYPAYYEEAPRSTDLYTMAKLYYDICKTEGVRADIAWAQMCLETKFLNFGGDVDIEQFNFAGIGATGGGVKGYDFAQRYGNNARGIRYGVIAQVQHLKAYASSQPAVYLNADKSPVDPRWNLVARGCAPTVEALSQKWAVGSTYGANIIAYLNSILNASKVASEDAEFQAVEQMETPATENPENIEEKGASEQPEEQVVYPVMAQSLQPNVTKEQLMNYYISNAKAIPSVGELEPTTAFPLYYGISLEEFAAMYIEEAAMEGVNAEVAFAQAMKDTNFLRFGGNIAIEDNMFMAYNTSGRIAYEDVRQGIRAQIQHLKCLASEELLANARVDVLWEDALRGSVKDAALLGGKAYGAELLAMLRALLAMPADAVAYLEPQPTEEPLPEAALPEETQQPTEETEQIAPPTETNPAQTEQTNQPEMQPKEPAESGVPSNTVQSVA